MYIMLIVTGLHRSGTTFLGNVIKQSNHYNYIHEPFNYFHGVKDVPCWYPYTDPISKSETDLTRLLDNVYSLKLSYKLSYEPDDSLFIKIIRHLVKGKEHSDYLKYKINPFKKEPLLKDPFLSICASYLALKYEDVKVIYIVRHPVAFYESLKRMDWNFDFKNLFDQENLVNDYFKLKDIEFPVSNKLENTVSLLWNVINNIIFDHALLMGKKKAYIIKHEDLSMDPLNEIPRLLSFLNLPFNQSIRQYIDTYMTNGIINPNSKILFEFSRNSKELAYSWKKTWKKEYETILRETQNIRKLFNYDS